MKQKNTKSTQEFEDEFFQEMHLAMRDTFTAVFTVEENRTLSIKFLDGRTVLVKVESA